MRLFLCNPRGFCAGVERAIKCVEKALDIWGAPIYVKHEIVHNKHVVNALKAKGAIFIEDLKEVPKGSRLIFSAHGVSPQVRQEAKELGLIAIDATCGLVTKVHSAAIRYAKKGYHILLIGHRNHVEVMGTYGEAPEATFILENVQDVDKLQFTDKDKLIYLTQTTLSLDDVKSIVEAIKVKYPQVESLPSSSICYATTNRQQALKSIVEKVDVVLVIGDPTSSNSNRLKEIALNRNTPAYLINSEKEINPSWLQNVKSIGLTAGASTPEPVVQQCIQKLKDIGVTHIEDITYTEEDVEFQLPKELIRTV